MMKHSNSIFSAGRGIILAIAIIAAGLFKPAHCQAYDTALLLQQTPVNGGRVNPAAGIHHFDMDTELTLTAVPNPGYQFVCWLGDVSDPAVSSTTVYLDAPKIVIAVFERSEYDFLAIRERAQSASSGGKVFPIAADYGRPAGSGAGAKRPSKPSKSQTPSEPEEEQNSFLVPKKGEEGPEAPEPATVVLLVLGGLFAFAKCRAKRQP
jgi:hypothetical protein